jgi:ABC-2 type transport system ATP-binding protein
MPDTDSVHIESLSKIYNRSWNRKEITRALDNVTLRVKSGEIFALLGPNGAGKSTLVKILLGIVRPSGGNVSILGKPVTEVSVHQWIGFLPEQPRFPGTMTARQVIRLSGELSGMRKLQIDDRIVRLVKSLGMEEWCDTKLKNYSKGMIQRTAIAQALVHDPEILFLDEPSDGLDPVARKEFRDQLKTLREEGKTIFLNSHLLSEVEILADRVGVIDKGHLLTIGTPADLAPPTGGYVVTLRPVAGPELFQDFPGVNISVVKGKTVIEVPTQEGFEKVMNFINRHGLPVESIYPVKPTLEDSYVALIKNELIQ